MVAPMRSARIVTAPDGTRWRVGRRWVTGPARRFSPRRRLRRLTDRDQSGWFAWVEPGDALGGGDDLLSGIALAVAAVVVVVLFVFVVIPLAGILLELLLLTFLLGSGIVGRVLLRRPWVIEAVDVAQPERVSAFGVRGWRRSRRALRELAAAIEANGTPTGLAEAERVTAG